MSLASEVVLVVKIMYCVKSRYVQLYLIFHFAFVKRSYNYYCSFYDASAFHRSCIIVGMLYGSLLLSICFYYFFGLFDGFYSVFGIFIFYWFFYICFCFVFFFNTVLLLLIYITNIYFKHLGYREIFLKFMCYMEVVFQQIC